MALDDDIAILSRAPLFAQMGHDVVRLISFAADRRTLAPGEELFRRGAASDGGYVVLSGSLALAPRHPAGEAIVAETGTLIGRNALLFDGPRPTTATARTACEVMRIPPALLRRVLMAFPDAAAAVQAALAEDLEELGRGLDRAGGSFRSER